MCQMIVNCDQLGVKEKKKKKEAKQIFFFFFRCKSTKTLNQEEIG